MKIIITIFASLFFTTLSIHAQYTISTVAGNGGNGYNGDNIQATSAWLDTPNGVAVDDSGNIYIADANNFRVRKVIVNSGLIITIAGTGIPGYNGDNIQATTAKLNGPNDVALDTLGNIYVAETGGCRIRKINKLTGIITTVAGNGTPGFNGDNIAATSAELFDPTGIALDVLGNIYIADADNNRIRKVSAFSGIITTVAGNGIAGYNGDNIAATSAKINGAFGIALDASRNKYIADGNNRIRKVNNTTGIITTIAGYNVFGGYNGDNILADSARLWGPTNIKISPNGNVYFVDRSNYRIRKITVSTGIITTIAGNGIWGYNGDNIPSITAELNAPYGMFLDSTGNIYIADEGNNRIRKMTPCNNIPPSPGAIVGNLNVCQGSTQIFSIDSVPNALNYTWSLPSGWSGTSISDSITIITANNSGSISIIANNACGSSSPQTLAITVNPTYNLNDSVSICNGNIFTFPDGSTSTVSTIHTSHLSTIQSCDSSIVTNLTVNTVDTSVSVLSTTLTSNANSSSYQWINCATMNPIIGAINQSYTATSNGNYAVIVTQNLCTDTSLCYAILSTSIKDITNHEVSIYPNPTSSILIIHQPFPSCNNQLIITDILGNEIYNETLTSIDNNISISSWNEGVYFYQIRSNEEIKQGKFIIEK